MDTLLKSFDGLDTNISISSFISKYKEEKLLYDV